MGKSLQTVRLEIFGTTVSMHVMRDIKECCQRNGLDYLMVHFHLCLILPGTSVSACYIGTYWVKFWISVVTHRKSFEQAGKSNFQRQLLF